MRPDELQNLTWLEPWHPVAAGLEAELEREVGEGHPLFGREAVAVGRRFDCDDVLFYLPGGGPPLAVVHLTWAGRREKSPEFPQTEFYGSVNDWVERRMRPDHEETGRG